MAVVVGPILCATIMKGRSFCSRSWIAIEASNTVVELLLHPFTDSEEDFYNLTWRLMAVGILVTALLIELVGEAFYVAGDAILVLLMTAALCVFLYALDPASIYRAYQRYTATKKCRKALHPARGEQQQQGGGGIDANMMKAALGDIPQGFWSKAAIVQDALSIVEMYKIAGKCDEDEDMHKLVVVHGLLYSAGPLMSLAGASNASLELGGNIPRSIGVFCSVTRLILADMNLEDGCGVEHLAAMARLEELRARHGVEEVIAFVPTGWAYDSKAEFSTRSRAGLGTIHLVPYSEHR